MSFSEVWVEVERAAERVSDLLELQRSVVDLIAKGLPRYDWVGFYMLDPEDASMLVLGAFHGAPTEHIRIPVTEGICGAAVARGETVVVEDVARDPRYIACSVETRSEMVAPIRARGRVVGEIDVDSHSAAAFGPEDREFVERCAALVGGFMAHHADG